jgi:hypothetical protein
MNQIVSTVIAGFPAAARADSPAALADNAFLQLREEYQAQRALFEAQPHDTRELLGRQARNIAQALVQGQRQIHLTLPDQAVIRASGLGRDRLAAVPSEFRQQVVAGLFGRLPSRDIRAAVRQRLTQLEQSPHPAVVVSARLLRYAIVMDMVHGMLPAGDSATQGSAPHGSPTPGAGRFYMPQWVAFDQGRLLVESVAAAEAHVAAMQRYLSTLHLAVSLAPYIFVDEEYQRKRNGMVGQLVNQGQALACYWTGEIIGKIRRKAASGQLDRGFSLSLPYFDDQMLEMKMLDFEVIPAGWVMFVPAFVVLAVRREQAKVAQDTRLGHSTRMHLLSELKTLERAFDAGDSR